MARLDAGPHSVSSSSATAMAAVVMMLVSVPTARASSITFHDTLAGLSVTHDFNPAEILVSHLNAPEQYTFRIRRVGLDTVSALDALGNPYDMNMNQYTTLRVNDANSVQAARVYHYMQPVLNPSQYIDMVFVSDGTTNINCFNNVPTCFPSPRPEIGTIFETGQLQNLLTVTWADGRIDTFNFINSEGDAYVDPVPEPGALVLLGTGLLTIGSRFRRSGRPDPGRTP